eukprot:CAMPEP_0196661526 /NCGR_PEP_ID=MMETSP1086-20130531/44685_1 /TAXON_ID=77921 /ORGANISM="Cyanoptyche  gloeocystis , Strain SAG4.97" /LENGTH=256 /DNA_ID=CAMNT_0041996461 /DNA_START=105 /DNA_END=875 /DNA_ORIENTATION=-
MEWASPILVAEGVRHVVDPCHVDSTRCSCSNPFAGCLTRCCPLLLKLGWGRCRQSPQLFVQGGPSLQGHLLQCPKNGHGLLGLWVRSWHAHTRFLQSGVTRSHMAVGGLTGGALPATRRHIVAEWFGSLQNWQADGWTSCRSLASYHLPDSMFLHMRRPFNCRMMTAVTSALSFFVAVVAAVEIVLGVVEAALAVFEGTLVPGKAHVAISAIAHAPSFISRANVDVLASVAAVSLAAFVRDLIDVFQAGKAGWWGR